MAYIVIKNIRGNRYYYWQRTYRQNGKVKTWNKYIGPVCQVSPVGLAPPISDRQVQYYIKQEATKTFSKPPAAEFFTCASCGDMQVQNPSNPNFCPFCEVYTND